MSVRPVFDNEGKQRKNEHGLGWQIDYYPNGAKGKRERFFFYGKEAAAYYLFLQLRRNKHRKLPVYPKVLDLFAPWLQYYENNRAKKTYEDVLSCLRVLVPFFGHLPADGITQEIIEDYKSKRLNDEKLRCGEGKVSRRCVAKELSYFSSMLSWAHECKHIPEKITFRNLPAEKPKKKSVLSPEEVRLLIDAIEPHYRLGVMLMTEAGLRRKEALTLRAVNVDLKNHIIEVVDGKGKKDRTIPILTDRLRLALMRRIKEIGKIRSRDPEYPDYLVLNPRNGKPYLTLKKALFRASAAAGLDKHVTHHLLRHTFGTLACVAEMNLRFLQGIMGHSNLQTTEGYLHLAEQIRRSEAAKFNSLTLPVKQSVGKLADNIIEFRPRR